MNMINKDEKRLTFYGFAWLSNDRIGFIKDDGGNENMHFYAVDIDTNEIEFNDVQARIIDDLENDPDHIILGLNETLKYMILTGSMLITER